MLDSSYPQLFAGGLMSYLRYLCFLLMVVSNIYCVVFLFCFRRLVYLGPGGLNELGSWNT